MKKALQVLTVLVWIFLLAFSGRTIAQETTASISGTVRDKSGPLAGVTIVAVHTPTGTQYGVSTRADGRFNISNVRIGGPYRLTASFIGYRTQTLPPFGLTISQNFDANIVLTESNVQLKEVVVTTAQNKTFNSNHTGASDIISRSQIERLPTINRSLNDFTKLTPFANSNQNYGSNSFGGRNNLYNNITVNGSSFNNTFGLSGAIGGQTGAQPISIDAIDQIQVNLAPYDVRQGSFTGAGINTVTKSGTNSITGSAYGYYQSPGLKGSKVGDITYPVGTFNYHLLGFSFGAPIIKNKLFLFLDAETERRTSPATSLVARQGSQVAGGNVSNADAATLDQLKNFLIKNYNYNPGTYQGYSYGFGADRITARLDYNINSHNTINFNFFYLKSNKDVLPSNSGAPSGGRQPNLNALPFSGAGYNIINNLASGIIQLNSTLSNAMSNKLELGYTAMRDKRKAFSNGVFPLVDILNPAGKGFTAFGYEPYTANNLLQTDIIQLNDYFTLSSGRHEIVLGTQNQIQSYKNGFDPNYNGAYVFSSAADFLNSATTGADLATQYQLGYSALSKSFPFAKVKNYQIGFFAQDKWRIKDNFNITYGVRLDIPTFSQTFSDNPAVHGLTFRDGLKESTSQKPKAAIQVSPRIGFNWDVFRNQTLQVRGGTGLFTGPPPQVWISNQAGNNGVQFGAIGAFTSKTKPKIGFPFSADINKYRPDPGPNNLPHSYNLVFVDQHFKFPKVWRSDFGLDYKLPGDVVATIEGFYTKDINAVNAENINLPRESIPLVGADPRPYFVNTKIYGGVIPSSPTNYSAPNITNAVLLTNSKKGFSYAASFRLERNVNGLYTALIYTHSDSRSVNDGGSIAQSIWRDRAVSGDPNADALSYSSYRLPNRALAILSYRKEYAKTFATSIGVTYELQSSGVGTYNYSGDANNDGQNSNDLVYIPRNASEINLQTYTVTNTITKVVTPYPAAQQWTDLNNYINQDPELKKRRGTYAERNGLVFPYYHQINLNFSQDFFFTLKNGKRNTLRFSADIYNFQNLLNPKWGILQVPVSTGGILKFNGVDKNNVPSYSVNYLDPDNLIPYTRTFRETSASAYAIQLGLKYIFQ